MIDLRDKRVLVMGLGIHGGGLGVTRFLVEQGAEVTVTDLRSPAQLSPSLELLRDLPVHYVLGEHREEDFAAADIVIRNPGVPRDSRFLRIARENGARIEMEMTLFFRLCPAPILAITGTKGKTTTTLLTGAMLRQQWPETVVAGNLRVSALLALPRITPETPVVLELSSWQLEGLGEAGLSPQYAAVTNISPDHLDRYGSMEEYIEAKRQIIVHQSLQDVAVLNADDPVVRGFAEKAPGRVWWFSTEEADVCDPALEAAQGPSLRWGIDGTLYEWVSCRHHPICTLRDTQLRGRHNLANIAAAAALARAYGASRAAIRAALREFPGVEHRMELVRELAGVRFINDSAATTPTAAAATLDAIKGPVVLIAGGADKRLSFAPLVEALRQKSNLRALVLLDGTATPRLVSELGPLGGRIPMLGPYDDFAAAVRAAREAAQEGDTVLLSPGCASFGMFRNEFHRGEEFRRLVGELV